MINTRLLNKYNNANKSKINLKSYLSINDTTNKEINKHKIKKKRNKINPILKGPFL